jgi:hypothetical protein
LIAFLLDPNVKPAKGWVFGKEVRLFLPKAIWHEQIEEKS